MKTLFGLLLTLLIAGAGSASAQKQSMVDSFRNGNPQPRRSIVVDTIQREGSNTYSGYRRRHRAHDRVYIGSRGIGLGPDQVNGSASGSGTGSHLKRSGL